ncbi:putative odorant receptor 92a [Tribolium madens]|uniref:putative odorant receptor 92a n=1 Tax=Tribolium madens TaxID=41895 RepID=UPI001CF72FB9|nr:putative odorant receptor 92a [Tribolium madens]
MEKVRLTEPLFLLHIVGMSPHDSGKFAQIRKIISILVYISTVSLSMIELFFNYKNLETLIRATESFFTQYGLGWKIAIFVIYKTELVQIIQLCDDLWSLDEFKIRHNFQFQHKFLRNFFLFYTGNLVILCTQFAVTAYFDNQFKSVIVYYGEQESFSENYDNFVFVLQVIYLYIGSLVVAGFDCFFFYLLGHAVSELKMLTISFSCKEIGKKWSYEERFKYSVKHHIYILELLEKINNVYSVMLLNQHLCSLFGICFGIFLMTKDGIPPDVDHFSKWSTYIFTFVLQVWMYCFAGDQIIHWSLKIPDEIFYNNHYWNTKYSFKDGLNKIIAIQRGQKAAGVSLGGFEMLHIGSFNIVIKNAVNFFMFMDKMYKRE